MILIDSIDINTAFIAYCSNTVTSIERPKIKIYYIYITCI